MGNHAFFGESKYNNLPRVKRFKTVFLIEPSFENASAEVCLRENVGFGVFTNGFWYFIWKILTGESHPSTPYFIPAILSIQQRAKYSATRMYHEIAIKNGLTTELSLAFIEQQPL
jgi:hypothetical protein